MKKLLLLICAIFLFAIGSQAQSSMSVPLDTLVVKDTIHYYFNKYYFKTATPLDSFPYYKSPAATVTVVTHVGSYFENSDTLDIHGLQAFASRNQWAVPIVPINLYLCNVTANGLPIMPPIDSVETAVTSTKIGPIGGPLKNGVKRLTGNYAVLFRNMSINSGDTANLLRTAGRTYTSGAKPMFLTSEGYGIVRYFGKYYSATNYTANGFGYSTDYEFCVAPIVQYTLFIGHDKPWETNIDDTLICTHEQVKFRSTCSKRISHRMYNLVEFRRRWDNNPNFHPNALAGTNLPPDSSGITWHFMPEDNRNYHLSANSPNGELIFYTDSARLKDDGETEDSVCFDGNEFRVRHHGMNLRGGKEKYNLTEPFKICTHFCNGDRQGVAEHALRHVKIYPNPALHGKATVTGLSGKTDIGLFNVLGQTVGRQVTENPAAEIDLSDQPQGTYMLRITNSSGSRTIKVIKQ